MKHILLLFFFIFPIISNAQDDTSQDIKLESEQLPHNPIYKLFPTENFWTFIKLDTRNGKMWQVQFAVGKDKVRKQSTLNSMPLVINENGVSGRFTLYPTENMYNFLLLDQIDGYVYQVQWSIEEANRIIIPIMTN